MGTGNTEGSLLKNSSLRGKNAAPLEAGRQAQPWGELQEPTVGLLRLLLKCWSSLRGGRQMEGCWWLRLGAVLGNGGGYQASVCTDRTFLRSVCPVPVPGDICSPHHWNSKPAWRGTQVSTEEGEGTQGSPRRVGRGAERMKREVWQEVMSTLETQWLR